MYLDILKETLGSQHKIITSYESITKKLEAQISECQDALEDSTKRETEQLQMIMDLKGQLDKIGDEDESDSDCETCANYEEENELLREQVDKQSLVITKLSKAQELLMLQYKAMETGLNQELAAITETQKELDQMKAAAEEEAAKLPPPPEGQKEGSDNKEEEE